MFVKLRFSFAAVALAVILGWSASPPAYSAPRSQAAGKDVRIDNSAVDVRLGRNVLTLRLVRENALRVHFEPNAKTTPTALVISAHAPKTAAKPVKVSRHDGLVTMTSKALHAELNPKTLTLSVYDARHHRLLLRQNDLAALAHRELDLRYAKGAPLYGIRGFNAFQHDVAGLLRHGRWIAKAGRQGNAGAPFVWSTRGFGLLIDTDGATFDLDNGRIAVRGTSRPDVDYYILAGKPKAIFSALADISGHAPLFPKWAMGFTNSQWGIDEQELLNIVKTYRRKHIPIDNFTLDFDWKAWGQGHYGEFRWNPKKFPDGPTGKLARMLDAKGVKLTGIMKPRIHIHTVEGRYATAHHFWVPGQKAYKDYFSHTLVKDIDFNKPAARAWFGHLAIKYAFDKGIVGWWNDEADNIDNTQFLNMERGLYETQRAHSDIRVWSINRNFWLGSQRYAYGLWSGDIHTGFATMAAQRERMLSAIDVGEMKWGMDGGGFQGHPSDQNYARWIEFGAFTPIFRVHGTHGEKRQPWRYGAVAEKAATRAIRLRYALIPYTYSYVWSGHVTGIGLVRPLIFAYPGDTQVRNDISAWMFGKWLLVSPVVKKDQTEKRIYLPRGTWTDYFTGKAYHGGRTITVPIHSKTWDDIPLFIRQGAIIPTQPVLDYVGQQPIHTITLNVFPAAHRTTFRYYDDNGETYAYTHGAYFLQPLSVQTTGKTVIFHTGAPRGTYRSALKYYLVKIHGQAATRISRNGHRLPHVASIKDLREGNRPGWSTGHDRYGDLTYIKLPAGVRQNVILHRANSPKWAKGAGLGLGNKDVDVQGLINLLGGGKKFAAKLD